MKMYFLVKDSVPLGLAITGVAHGSMMAMEDWYFDSEFRKWKEESFKKVIVKVTQEEFERARRFNHSRIIVTESSLGGEETVIVFKPTEEVPSAFKYYPLYKENEVEVHSSGDS